MKKADSVIKAPYLITMAPGDRDLHRDWAVAIHSGMIEEIGPYETITSRYEAAEIHDLAGHLVMPGMINTHGHVPMIGYAGKMPDGIPFDDVLFRYMLPLEREFLKTPGFVYYCTLLGCRELAMAGVTTTVEMYYEAEEMIKAFSETGLRAVIGETVMSDFPAPSGRDARGALSYIRELHKRLPPAGERLQELAVAPHSAYACDDETLLSCSSLAGDLGIPLLMHCCETPDEAGKPRDKEAAPPSSFYRSRPSVTSSPLAHLAGIGIFNVPRVLLAHCIYLEESDIEAMAACGAGASYNGICNTQIGLEIAPVAEMQKAGIPVGVGTDGPLTNDRLDILSQLLPLMCFQRHRARKSATLSCHAMCAMATIEGARAIGLEKKTGSLEKGKHADIIALSLDGRDSTSLYLDNDSVYAWIVKKAFPSSVAFSMVGGRKPRIPDRDKIMAELSPALERIRAWEP
ncbi:MAG: amidohydrolase family protein [Candidatus Eremiobacteraeota bacterium]|nr:amidohydrolase family protein [Candidatus Eremiobacteraeota bacterium]